MTPTTTTRAGEGVFHPHHPAPRSASAARPADLLRDLRDLRQHVAVEGQRIFDRWRPSIRRRAFLGSAINMAHYLALRQRDLRELQAALVPWGLSSLGRSEAHVLPTLDAVIWTLRALDGEWPDPEQRPTMRSFRRGGRRLEANTRELFGGRAGASRIHIMVTLGAEAAADRAMVRDLVRRGMDCARINCAHDDPTVWAAIIAQIRGVAADAGGGHECRIAMDLCGPRVRTGGVITPGPDARLRQGDRLLLTRDTPTDPARMPFQASCSIPDVIDLLEVGGRVWIDDGSIGCDVVERESDAVVLRVTHVRPRGKRLVPDKGLNFPGTTLPVGALTDQDRVDLDFIAAHADVVGYSFVQDAADVQQLQDELRRRRPPGAPLPALIAKIETQRAVENLPSIIAQAAGRQPFGVMIARGDLAVEIGYQRLAEVQEEVMWLCESAHIPVVWATQVLERLVKKGTPSRAEITDAAMAERAECVMLNKGPFAAEAVTLLTDVLTRMQEHQHKKTPRMRALRVWRKG